MAGCEKVLAMSVEQLRLHEIAEADNVVLNPFTEGQLDLLGGVCRLRPGQRQLDLACGKGEMLCRWARDFGVTGVGVDVSSVFLDAARHRAEELEVTDQITFVRGDAAEYRAQAGGFDVVSCIGATWIGGGLAGTLALMRPALREDGLLLVGEPFWNESPPPEAYAAFEIPPGEYVSLAETAERFTAAGFELVEMVLANQDGWDRYVAPHWWAIDRWLRDHPGHPDASALRKFGEAERVGHLTYGRRYLGWGVFVLRPAATTG
jgi:SAM-dependent methyltransferase